MATYVIGDLQGCFTPLLRLLDRLKFDPAFDRLWFAGDLVSRGQQSLQTLRFAKTLGHSSISVLGNHDISLIAAAFGIIPLHKSLRTLYNAPDFAELLDWLRHRPLLHTDDQLNAVMVHAGIPPEWDLTTAQQCAREVEQQLQAKNPAHWLESLYGDQPSRWDPKAPAQHRQRFTVNALTRMRYCTADHHLELKQKLSPRAVAKTHPKLYPWFRHPKRRKITQTIYFGHWSTLGYHQEGNIMALDSGCVWGGRMTAVRIDSHKKTRYQVACTEYGR
ncbi:MAG: diadenosine tetraphosphatase [Thiothrix nivea]|nr:MAG: diadenosine tetraphosphatase [Thiothrix nivea]